MTLDAFVRTGSFFLHLCIHGGEFGHLVLERFHEVGNLQLSQVQFVGGFLLLILQLGLGQFDEPS